MIELERNQHLPFTDARYRTVEAPRVVSTLMAYGWPFEVRHGDGDLAAREAESSLDRLVALGLPSALSKTGERLFDPVEVINFLVWSGRSGSEPIFARRFVPTARRQAWEAFGTETNLAMPPSLAALGPQCYVVFLRRVFDLRRKKSGERIRLRLPLALEDDSLTGLRIEELPPTQPAEIMRAADRLEILTTVPSDHVVEIGVRQSFTCHATIPARRNHALNSTDAELYTRPSEGLVKVSERIRVLAARLGGKEHRPWELVSRFWCFILDNLNCSAIHYDRLDQTRPLDTVLDEGWCDCRVGSALMVALCRASKIPARLVSGYLLYETAPAHHSWLECWIDTMGWAPFDLYFSLDDMSEWRDHFLGKLDHRMVVERPPHLFSGTGTVRLPAAWHMVRALDERGTSVEYRTLDNRELIYREHIEVARQPASVTRPTL